MNPDFTTFTPYTEPTNYPLEVPTSCIIVCPLGLISVLETICRK